MPKAKMQKFEVLISFDGLDKGDVFSMSENDPWALGHVESGYLRDVTTEEVAHERGEVSPG